MTKKQQLLIKSDTTDVEIRQLTAQEMADIIKDQFGHNPSRFKDDDGWNTIGLQWLISCERNTLREAGE